MSEAKAKFNYLTSSTVPSFSPGPMEYKLVVLLRMEVYICKEFIGLLFLFVMVNSLDALLLVMSGFH